MKRITLFLIIAGLPFGCQQGGQKEKEDYRIEVSVNHGHQIQKLNKLCLYDRICTANLKLLAHKKFKTAEVKVESLRSKKVKGKEWYFNVNIKTVNPLGREHTTSRTFYTTSTSLRIDPVIFQSEDFGRIEIKDLP